jgi:hypothetical protein
MSNESSLPSSKDEIDSVLADNALLLAQLDAARKTTMQQAMAEMLRQAKDSANANDKSYVPAAGTVFTGMVDRQRRNTGMFSGIDDAIRAVAAFARMGDEGVAFLLGVAKDKTNYSDDERKEAEQLLATLPHPDALNFFLQEMDADMKSGSETDHREEIYWQALALTSEALAPYSDTLNAQAQELMARGNSDLLCLLGLYHADPAALQRLHEPTVYAPERFQDVLQTAQFLHTEQAYDYLVEAQRMVKDADTLRRISDVLDKWDE